MMICTICRHGELVPGEVVITRCLEATTLVLKQVPALICDNCGEEYLEDDIVEAVQGITQRLAASGVEVIVTAFHQAA